MRSVVTGANRGIGLEFVKQLLARGDRVVAGARDPNGANELQALAASSKGALAIHACDIGDGKSVASFAAACGSEPIDLLINNAGVYGGSAQRVDSMDFDEALRTYEINALGPLRVTLALRDRLARGKSPRVVHLTSGMGSIEDNKSGGFYAYRMSKAALNMASRSLAIDLRDAGVVSVVINPGWVKTDMGGAGAAISANESVRSMLTQIDGATLAQSGSFLNWRGGGYPW